jgi:hypothetical protein
LLGSGANEVHFRVSFCISKAAGLPEHAVIESTGLEVHAVAEPDRHLRTLEDLFSRLNVVGFMRKMSSRPLVRRSSKLANAVVVKRGALIAWRAAQSLNAEVPDVLCIRPGLADVGLERADAGYPFGSVAASTR